MSEAVFFHVPVWQRALISIVTCLVRIHFSVLIVATIIAFIRARRPLCPGKIGSCKGRTAHTVRIGSL
jgi:hypothetical protein